MRSSIAIKKETAKKINLLKLQKGFKSADEVINYLLKKEEN